MRLSITIFHFSRRYPVDLSFLIIDNLNHNLAFVIGPQCSAFLFIDKETDRSFALVEPALRRIIADAVSSIMLLKKCLPLQFRFHKPQAFLFFLHLLNLLVKGV